MKPIVLDGKKLAKEIEEQLKIKVLKILKTSFPKPH